jgi:cytochrome P450
MKLPTERPAGCPFDPPAELAELRPLTRIEYHDGHIGWLVTGYALARAVAADTRFSSRHDLQRSPFPGTPVIDKLPPAPPGMFVGMDPPDHTRYRRLLTGKFTVRRMRLLTERVEQVTVECLDAMRRQGPPVDLVRVFAQVIPAMMICELLGVPTDGRETFQRQAETLNDKTATLEEIGAAYVGLQDTLRDLILAKRAEPTDELLSDLTATDLTDEELVNIGVLLLGAGLDTTANMLALGTFALLSHPGQIPGLKGDNAVEELLRFLSVAHTGVRTALEDVELGGRVIKAGDSVTLSIMAANRDPERFADPDTLDLSRSAAGHAAFGHGIHQCLGQQLARIEMRVGFSALFTRFPTLRLAIPAGEVPLRTDSDVYGVHKLPVTWDV